MKKYGIAIGLALLVIGVYVVLGNTHQHNDVAVTTASTLGADIPGLPPDPGEAGKQTLAGTDFDRDGVRDDVQRFIASQDVPAPVKAALTKYARAAQDFVLHSAESRDVLLPIVERSNDSADCLKYLYRATEDRAQYYRVAVRSVVLNTIERNRAYVVADSKLSGLFFTTRPENTWAGYCDN